MERELLLTRNFFILQREDPFESSWNGGREREREGGKLDSAFLVDSSRTVILGRSYITELTTDT